VVNRSLEDQSSWVWYLAGFVRLVFPRSRLLPGCFPWDRSHHHGITSSVALSQAVLEVCVVIQAESVVFLLGNVALPHVLA